MTKIITIFFEKKVFFNSLLSSIGEFFSPNLNIESKIKKGCLKSLFLLFLAFLPSFIVSAQINQGVNFDLNVFINSRLDQGQTTVTVPPGRYRVNRINGNGDTHLYFHNRDNVTIIADGVEMICTSTVQAVKLFGCDNFKIQGLTVDYDPLPFTQGTIVGMSADKLTLMVDLISGYPSTNINGHCEIYDPTSGELVTTTYYGVSYNVNQAIRRVIITKPSNYIASNSFEDIGDIVVMQSNNGSHVPHAFVLENCTNLTLENTIVYSGTAMGYIENYGSSNKYINCKIKRRPLATEVFSRGVRRMRTTNIDGFHSKYAKVGPSYVGCEVEYNGDDGFAINGDFEVVLATNGNMLEVVGKAGQAPDLVVGETLEIISYTGERLADATITGFAKGRAVTAAEKAFLQSQTYYAEAAQTHTATNVYNVTINRAISLPIGSLVNSANKVGNGFEIRNCVVRGNRSRGILVKASNGTITGNTLTNNWLQAINSSPEFEWLEAGNSSNLVITNNTISGCRNAGISVFSFGGNGSISPAGAHRNIQISGNVISGSTNPAIVVTSTNNLTINSNTITSPNNSILAPWYANEFGRNEDSNRQIYLFNNGSAQTSVSGLSVNSAINISTNQTSQLTATVTPSDATNKNVTWTSSNSLVASVSSTGLVTSGNISGTQTAIITVTTQDGGYTAQCVVTVSEPVATSPIAHFKFDEDPSTTTVVNTGTDTAISATISLNGGIITPGVSDGVRGQVIQINSAYNAQVVLRRSGNNYSGITGGGARTYAFWIRQNTVTFAAIMYNGVPGSGSLFNVQIDGGRIRMTDDFGNFIYTAETLNAGQWHHVVMVVPQNAKMQDIKFYIDGAAATQTYGGANVTINTGAGFFNLGSNLSGFMSDFRYYSSGLSAIQVANLYSAPSTYTISYNGNGNTGGTVPENQIKIHGVNLELASNSGNLTRTGSTLLGWNTQADGLGVDYDLSGNYTTDAVTTLYAKWSNNDLNIAYNKPVVTKGANANPASNLVNENLSARWSASGYPQWAEIDLGNVYDISRLEVYPYLNRAYRYTIETKLTSASAYSTVVDRSNNTLGTSLLTDYVDVTGRYLRITITGATSYTGTFAALNELKAFGSLASHAVTYNGNGNTNGTAPANQAKVPGVNLVLAYNSGNLARTGYTFLGWNTQADGLGVDYALSANYATDALLTLYAKWIAIPTYIITYNSNGNTSGTAPANQTKTQGANITLAANSANLARIGYTFSGWNTQADGNGINYAEEATYITDEALTLYAKWVAIPTYTITYDGNSNTSGTAPANQTKTQGVSITLAANSGGLVRIGYTFSGWNTQADGLGVDYAISSNYATDAPLTLYAKWVAIPTYTITYNDNSSTSGTAPTTQTKTQGISITLADNNGNLERVGYTFSGWNTQADGLGVDYAISTSYNTDEPLTLYAKWVAIPTYEITYHSNGNTSGTAPATQIKTQSVSIALAANSGNLEKTGYSFEGWNTQADGSGADYAEEAIYTTDATLTLYAKWTATTLSNPTVDSPVAISIYPNPVKGGVLGIKPQWGIKISKLEMFDMTGRLVYANAKSNLIATTINVINFEAGVYLLKAIIGDRTESLRIVIE